MHIFFLLMNVAEAWVDMHTDSVTSLIKNCVTDQCFTEQNIFYNTYIYLECITVYMECLIFDIRHINNVHEIP